MGQPEQEFRTSLQKFGIFFGETSGEKSAYLVTDRFWG